MADAAIIGRVAVKVIPDTGDFRAQAERELSAIEKSLKDIKVEIEPVVDKKRLAKAIKQTIKEAEKSKDNQFRVRVKMDDPDSLRSAMKDVQTAIDKFDTVVVKTDVDRKSLEDLKAKLGKQLDAISKLELRYDPTSLSDIEGQIGEIDKQLQDLRRIDVEVDLDEKSLFAKRQELQKVLNDAAKLELAIDNDSFRRVQSEVSRRLGELKLNPVVDPKVFRDTTRKMEKLIEEQMELHAQLQVELPDRERAEIKHRIDQIKDELDGLEGDISIDINEAGYRAAQLRLATLARTRFVEYVPTVSKVGAAKVATTLAALSGGRALTNVIGDLREFFSNIDKNLPLIGSLALAIAGLTGWVITGVSNLFAMSQSLAQIGGAALALPAIFASAAIGVGVLIAAFKDFNKIFPGFKDKLSELQDAISKNFWSEAEGGIRNLLTTLFPQFQKGLSSTATELGSFFNDLGNSLSQSLDGALAPMFDNLNKSIEIASGATDGIARAIKNLGTVGSQYLPRLSGWVVDVANKFDAWLNQAAHDGRLKEFIDTGIEQLKALGRVLFNLGGILAGIAEAAEAAGGSSLSMIADTLERVSKVVNGPTFQRLLTGVFEAAHTAMAAISDKAGPAFEGFVKRLARTLQQVLPVVGDTLGTALGAIFDALDQPAVQKGALDFFKGLQKGVKGLAPAMKPVGKALGTVAGLLGDLASHLGPSLGNILGGIAKGIEAMGPGLGDMIGVLGQGLEDLTAAAAPLLDVLGKQLGRVFKAVAPELGKLFQDLTPTLKDLAPVLGDLFKSLGDLAVELAPALGELARTILPPLVNLMVQWAPVLVQVVDALAGLAGVFSGGGFGKILALLSPLGQLVGLWWLLTKALQAAWGALKQVAAFMSKIGDINDKVAGALRSAGSAVLNFFRGLPGKVGGAISKMAGAVQKGVSKAIDFLSRLPGRAAAFVQQMGGRLLSGAQNALSRMAGAVSNGVGRVVSFLRSLPGKAASAVSSLVGRLFSTGQRALARMGSAVQSGISKVVGFFKGLPDKVISAIGDLVGRLYNLGVNAIEGLINGITSKVGDLISTAQSLADKITGPFKTAMSIFSPSRVMRELGHHVGDGLILGIRDKGRGVARQSGFMAELITDGFWKKFRKKLRNVGDLSELKQQFRSLTDSLAQQLEKAFGRKQQAIAKEYKDRLADLKKEFKGQPKQLKAATAELDKWRKAAEKAAKVRFSLSRKEITESIKHEYERLKDVVKKYGEYGKALDKAREKLKNLRQEAKSYHQTIASGIIDFGTVVFGGDETGPLEASDILKQLDDARDKAKAFAQVLKQLKKAGLSKRALDQLASAGPEAALASAQAILGGGKKTIKQINQMQAQIAKAARAAADVATKAMFSSGLAAAQGLVVGIEHQMKPLAQKMRELAMVMVKTIKKELKIHSPSKVFEDLGGFVGKGFAQGIDNQAHRVTSALVAMAGARPTGLGNIATAAARSGASVEKHLHYYAADGSSLGSEEDLFAASNRARMMGW